MRMSDVRPPSAADTAIVLVNLGTPDAPTPGAVRRYLSQFLMDPRVVQIPRLMWWPLLHFVILPLRSRRVAHKYAEIWMSDGSPLAVFTRRLAAAVQARMPQSRVVHAMRYGQPAVGDVLAGLQRDGVKRAVVLPLYPQYSTTTTASVDDAVRQSGALPAHVIPEYHLDAGWLQAAADSIQAHWDTHGRGERLVFSFHGLPQRVVDNGDPYAAQCAASVAAIAGLLGLHENDYVLTFQSRFGKERWLEPATITTLESLARSGVRRVDVVCPGFAVDCLETLEEIAQTNADAFRAAGGQKFQYIPCLNDAPAHADALAALAEKALRA